MVIEGGGRERLECMVGNRMEFSLIHINPHASVLAVY